ncbi:hypothetical protein THASP1DRAFT_13242 [Thamnocephalis sphaerospora]|uniref:Integral membrane protein n=1 Tax=Thamnocephalis sphaerospora TaxID=78915 RepID=A0A4P9XXI5_9FUNG|nr:hypothetical protein THASP1DRAFT_13242 [Thamnocephalis sphaerospora]|eukprot:RKP10160.1 hypothetical protein THASP1DRAFT_13242 [Thamnocephalis sphaerospora]
MTEEAPVSEQQVASRGLFRPQRSNARLYIGFLVAGMLFTGTCNTLLNKVQDMQCVENCDDPDPRNRKNFEQPVYQTLNMFIGELMCLFVAYAASAFTAFRDLHEKAEQAKEAASDLTDLALEAARAEIEQARSERKPLTGRHILLLWLPTLCDICGTTLMNVGLIYTTASIYQMLRGAVVIFSAFFSILFLSHRLRSFQWFALCTVVTGVALVGLSSITGTPSKPASLGVGTDAEAEDVMLAAIGVIMVLAAQVFAAAQFVIEEKIMTRYAVEPILAVGLEGLFGCITVLAAMPILYLLFGLSHPNGFFDFPTGWHQIWDHQGVWVAGIAIALSIAFFNWFGLSVTRTVSSVSRATIDTCRTLFIWMVSLGLGWESFKWLQVVGFVLLVYGTFLYNGVVRPPKPFRRHGGEEIIDETEPILPRE